MVADVSTDEKPRVNKKKMENLKLNILDGKLTL
jgi:hypothetical protein